MKYKLRWLQEFYEVTREDVVAHREKYGSSMVEAMNALRPRLPPVLQYFEEDTQEWFAVPFEYLSLGKKRE